MVERDERKAEEAAAAFDCLVTNDDATVEETLTDAGCDRADALVSTTDQDAVNIMGCLLGQEFDVPAIVSVVPDPDHMDLFRRIGVNTIENPQRLIAESLYRAVKRPSIVDYMRVGDRAEVFEITVTEDATVAGRTIREAADEGYLAPEMLVVAIYREDAQTGVVSTGVIRRTGVAPTRVVRRTGMASTGTIGRTRIGPFAVLDRSRRSRPSTAREDEPADVTEEDQRPRQRHQDDQQDDDRGRRHREERPDEDRRQRSECAAEVDPGGALAELQDRPAERSR
jgi:trk system potassium uptake protein TrkA